MFSQKLADLKTETVDGLFCQSIDVTELFADCSNLYRITEESEPTRQALCRWADVLKIPVDEARMILMHGFQLGFKAAQAGAEAEQLERLIQE